MPCNAIQSVEKGEEVYCCVFSSIRITISCSIPKNALSFSKVLVLCIANGKRRERERDSGHERDEQEPCFHGLLEPEGRGRSKKCEGRRKENEPLDGKNLSSSSCSSVSKQEKGRTIEGGNEPRSTKTRNVLSVGSLGRWLQNLLSFPFTARSSFIFLSTRSSL